MWIHFRSEHIRTKSSLFVISIQIAHEVYKNKELFA